MINLGMERGYHAHYALKYFFICIKIDKIIKINKYLEKKIYVPE